MGTEAALRALATALALLAAAVAAAGAAGPAGAADECKGLRVCLPIAGPWVVVPAGAAGAEWELACPLRGYTVAGTDARVATPDVDVSIRGRTGSPVSPGVTTGRSVVFRAVRTGSARSSSSFRPFAGCIPGAGGGGRALTAHIAAGLKPGEVVLSTVVTVRITRPRQVVRATCPARTRLVGATDAVGFEQAAPPDGRQRASVVMRRSTQGAAVVARVSVRGAVDGRTRVQVRALCTRSR